MLRKTLVVVSLGLAVGAIATGLFYDLRAGYWMMMAALGVSVVYNVYSKWRE